MDEEEMGEDDKESYGKRTRKDGDREMVRIRHFTWDYVEQETRLR